MSHGIIKTNLTTCIINFKVDFYFLFYLLNHQLHNLKDLNILNQSFVCIYHEFAQEIANSEF